MSIIESTYKLCNYLRKTDYSENLKEAIERLNKSNSQDSDGGHFGYVARHHTIQFLSYLYVNQNYEKMNQLMAPFKMKPLSENEVSLFEKGHNLLLKINQQIQDYLSKILPNSGAILDLYSKTKTTIISKESIDIPYSYIDDLTKEFYQHKSFEIIIKAANDFPKIKDLPKTQIILGVNTLLREINESDFLEVPNSIREMNSLLPREHIGQNVNRILRALSCLKISLIVLNQIIYQACKREKLTVLDNSNVSRIINHNTFYLGEAIILEAQPNHKCNPFVLPRSCCYLNIDVDDSYKIKGLFWLHNHSFSFGGEYGEIEKFWLKRIDDDLNYLIRFNHY